MAGTGDSRCSGWPGRGAAVKSAWPMVRQEFPPPLSKCKIVWKFRTVGETSDAEGATFAATVNAAGR
ncbi:MAG: hypothetical protein HPY58_10360 [Firmicutes bacterium]|nr:hypothetical protein [Bacillota bacterium]